MNKQVGFIGLGKMGKVIVKRLLDHDYEVVAYDKEFKNVEKIQAIGAIGVTSVKELVQCLKPQRIIWLMVPAGKSVDGLIKELLSVDLKAGDIIIDGGNSNYQDTIRRANKLQKSGVHYFDVGTSGGIHCEKTGFSLTIGGPESLYETIRPILASIGNPEGYNYIGPSGSGHFVKMVHNAIEYGIMQAMGEGFELLKKGPYKDLDLKTIAHVWNHGSIIRSFLLELMEQVFKKEDSGLSDVVDYVDDSGEGRWALQEAIKFNVPFDTNAHALFARIASRQDESFSAKIVSVLRHEFGGHEIKRKLNR
ncbi:MAG TPA: decarboxylating 6-phosphogluconate dehydrogenase [Candidatus Methanoperedens sp.]